MKQIYICLLLTICLRISAQKLPTGVTVDKSEFISSTFLFSDSNDVIWSGMPNLSGGLMQFKNSTWTEINSDAFFYDAFEIKKGELYLPSSKGLYYYDGNSLQL